MKTKYILFTADVQVVQAAKLREIITQTINQKYDELYFLISSTGGNVIEGLSLAAYIKALPMETIMHNIGQVDSVATAIFSAGKKRISSQNASFMFHGVTMNLKECNLLEQQLKEIYESSKRMKSDIAKAISTYIGLPLSDIEKLMIDGGVILTAEEAKRNGFITDIIDPQIPQGADISSISNA
jgi:ATP-dependent protease ClpP protease subunit